MSMHPQFTKSVTALIIGLTVGVPVLSTTFVSAQGTGGAGMAIQEECKAQHDAKKKSVCSGQPKTKQAKCNSDFDTYAPGEFSQNYLQPFDGTPDSKDDPKCQKPVSDQCASTCKDKGVDVVPPQSQTGNIPATSCGAQKKCREEADGKKEVDKAQEQQKKPEEQAKKEDSGKGGGGEPPQPKEKEKQQQQQAQNQECSGGQIKNASGGCETPQQPKSASEVAFASAQAAIDRLIATEGNTTQNQRDVAQRIAGQFPDAMAKLQAQYPQLLGLTATAAYNSNLSPFINPSVIAFFSSLLSPTTADAAPYSDSAVTTCTARAVAENKRLTTAGEPGIALLPLGFTAFGKGQRMCMFRDVLAKVFTGKCTQQCADRGGLLIVLADNKEFGKGCLNKPGYSVTCRDTLTTRTNYTEVLRPDERSTNASSSTSASVRPASPYNTTSAATTTKTVTTTLTPPTLTTAGTGPNAGKSAPTLSLADARARFTKAHNELAAVIKKSYKDKNEHLAAIRAAATELGAAAKQYVTHAPKEVGSYMATIQDKYTTYSKKYTDLKKKIASLTPGTPAYTSTGVELFNMQKQATAYSTILRAYK